jgi:hypothetical protein
MHTETPTKTETLVAGLTETEITDLKTKHGEIYVLEHPVYTDATVIGRRPTRLEYDRFITEAGDDRKNVKTKALENFVKRAIVHPERAKVEVLLDRYPGLVSGYGDKLLEIIAVDQRVEAKKL